MFCPSVVELCDPGRLSDQLACGKTNIRTVDDMRKPTFGPVRPLKIQIRQYGVIGTCTRHIHAGTEDPDENVRMHRLI